MDMLAIILTKKWHLYRKRRSVIMMDVAITKIWHFYLIYFPKPIIKLIIYYIFYTVFKNPANSSYYLMSTISIIKSFIPWLIRDKAHKPPTSGNIAVSCDFYENFFLYCKSCRSISFSREYGSGNAVPSFSYS